MQPSPAPFARRYSDRVVLQCLRRYGELSRQELARLTALSPQTISLITRDLLAQELLRVAGRQLGKRGQPTASLALNRGGAYAIGVDVRADEIEALLIDFEARVRARHTLGAGLSPGLGGVLDAHRQSQIKALIGECLTSVPAAGGRLLGVGLTLPEPAAGPGPVSGLREQLDGFKRQLRADLGVTLIGEPVPGAAALAELVFGAAVDGDDFFYVHIGRQLDGFLVARGELPRDAAQPGRFGDYPVAGTNGMLAPLREHLALPSSYHAAAGQKERSVARPRGRLPADATADIPSGWGPGAARALAQALVGVTTALDPVRILVGGALPEPLLQCLVRQLVEHMRAYPGFENHPHNGVRASEVAPWPALQAAALPLYAACAPRAELLTGRTERRTPGTGKGGLHAGGRAGEAHGQR